MNPESRNIARRAGRNAALLVVCALVLGVEARSFGQQIFRVAPGVSAQLGRVRFQILSGRVHALNDTPGGRLNFSTKRLGRGEETLTVDLSGPQPAIDYSIDDRRSRLAVSLADGSRLRATVEPQGSSQEPHISLEQEPGGLIRLKIASSDATEEYSADTLWHLFLDEPEVAAKRVAPILGVLRPGWPLAQQAGEIERQLLAMAKDYQPLDRGRIQDLIDQLGSEDFTTRREADRALREYGVAIGPYLQSALSQTTDAERRFRLRRIVKELAELEQEDVPIHVARRMLGDSRAWLSLLKRDDSEIRAAAIAHLRRIQGEELEFDPDADAETRAAQWERIAKHITG